VGALRDLEATHYTRDVEARRLPGVSPVVWPGRRVFGRAFPFGRGRVLHTSKRCKNPIVRFTIVHTSRRTMKLRAFSLLVLLSILPGIAACGEKPAPTETVIATDHKQTAPPSDNTMSERISRLMEFYEESGQFSGTILVAQDGNIIYEDAFGWANLEWRIPNSMDTKFRVFQLWLCAPGRHP
jgi:hypothetical protein